MDYVATEKRHGHFLPFYFFTFQNECVFESQPKKKTVMKKKRNECHFEIITSNLNIGKIGFAVSLASIHTHEHTENHTDVFRSLPLFRTYLLLVFSHHVFVSLFRPIKKRFSANFHFNSLTDVREMWWISFAAVIDLPNRLIEWRHTSFVHSHWFSYDCKSHSKSNSKLSSVLF